MPLWYVKDTLSQGQLVAADVLERGQTLERGLGPAPDSPSMLLYVRDQVAEHTLQLNRESQSVLIALKVLQEKLINE